MFEKKQEKKKDWASGRKEVGGDDDDDVTEQERIAGSFFARCESVEEGTPGPTPPTPAWLNLELPSLSPHSLSLVLAPRGT